MQTINRCYLYRDGPQSGMPPGQCYVHCRKQSLLHGEYFMHRECCNYSALGLLRLQLFQDDQQC